MWELYNIMRKPSQRKLRLNRPVKTKSGMLLTQEEQLKRWEEHFSKIFNKDDNSKGSKQEMRNAEEEDNSENENETEVNLDPPIKTEIQLALSQRLEKQQV